MESDLLVGWAKQAPLHWSETDVLLSEPPHERRLSQALGEPPMRSGGQSGGEMSHSHSQRRGKYVHYSTVILR